MLINTAMMLLTDRHTLGLGVWDGGQLNPQNPGRYSGKRQHICLTNCAYISGGVTKETFIGYYSMTVKK